MTGVRDVFCFLAVELNCKVIVFSPGWDHLREPHLHLPFSPWKSNILKMMYVQEQVRSEGMCEPTIFQVTSLCDKNSSQLLSLPSAGAAFLPFPFCYLITFHSEALVRIKSSAFWVQILTFSVRSWLGPHQKAPPTLFFFFLQINQKCRFFLVHLMWGFPSPSVLSLALAFIHTVRLQLQIVIPGERPLTQAGWQQGIWNGDNP